MKILNIKWDKKINMTTQSFFWLVVSWFICGFAIGIMLGLIV